MIFAYLRVSKDTQDTQNQKVGVVKYCEKEDMFPVSFIEDTASGKIDWRERELGAMLEKMHEGDELVVSEFSRIARNTIGVLEVLEYCINKGIIVHIVKQGMKYDGGLQSKVMATMFALAAQIERELISERTKEGLARTRAEGTVLGRPKGRGKKKLDERAREVKALHSAGHSDMKIAKVLGVSRPTVTKYLKENKMQSRLERG